MKIYTRADWGARAPTGKMTPQGKPTESFGHYSVTAGAERIDTLAEQINAMRSIQAFHQHGRGYSDIAYHYVVFQPHGPLNRARVFQGRDVRFVPAAQEGHNSGTLAWCVVADQDDLIQRNTRFVIEELLRRFPSVRTLGGHRDVTPTSCPGTALYAAIPRIAKAAGKKVYADAA